MITRYRFIVDLCLIFLSPGFLTKGYNKDYLDYIDTYHEVSIELMRKCKIPASIILAQGLLESGGGESQLAKEANNHFGIKCHSGWMGECYYLFKDECDECFRKYEKVEDSFEDYSSFLHRERYSSLFTLNIQDYMGWARGIQNCGYATDKFYADKLIKLIEDYKLYQFDEDKKNTETEYSETFSSCM